MSISIPFNLHSPGHIAQKKDEAESIRNFLELLVSTPIDSVEADPEFGFVFKNFRFENFNEKKGVLHSSSEADETNAFYRRKVYGRSLNNNTFAYDLKKAIEKYEPRLRQVRVNMEYKQLAKVVTLTINGVTGESIAEKFSHQIKIHVW